MEVRSGALRRKAFALVHRQQHRSARAPQQIGDRPVLRGKPFARIDQENHDVGFGDRLPRLLGHRMINAGLRLRLEAAGVDDQIGAIAAAAASVVPVARQARKIGDQRSSRLASGG